MNEEKKGILQGISRGCKGLFGTACCISAWFWALALKEELEQSKVYSSLKRTNMADTNESGTSV